MVWPVHGVGRQSYCAMTRAEMQMVEAMRNGNQKGGGKGGGGKGIGGKSASKTDQVTFICKWADCKAGTQQTATIGQTLCHCCKRARGIAMSPPLEKMSQRAYNVRMGISNATEQQQGKGKGKGKGKKESYEEFVKTAPLHDLTAAEKKLRITRLAELKTLKEKGGVEAKETDVKDATMEVPQQEDEDMAHARILLGMGLYPAPTTAEVKAYSRPVLKEDGQSAMSQITEQITKLEQALETAKANSMPNAVIKAYDQEILDLKSSQPKPARQAQSKGALLTQLQHRLEGADAAAQHAEERHQNNVAALDKEIKQLSALKDHRIKDFEGAKKAFAVRLVEDKQAVNDLMADLGTLVQDLQPTEIAIANGINQGINTALADLQRHFDMDAKDLPECSESTDPIQVASLASLWHFYSQVAFGEVPPITFDGLQIQPCFAHTLIGDTAWYGFWGKEAGTGITGSQYIPRTLHNYLRYVVQTQTAQLAGMTNAKEKAQQRLQAANALKDQRRKDGEPY